MGRQIALIYLLCKNYWSHYLYISTGSVSEGFSKILDLVSKFFMVVYVSFLKRVGQKTTTNYGISLSVQYLLSVATASTKLTNVTGLII
jgi:hypothetical protein